MDKVISNDVQDSLDTNSSNRADERKMKYGAYHVEQRNSKLPCKNFLGYDLVKQCKENSFNLLNLKREEKRKEEIKEGMFL